MRHRDFGVVALGRFMVVERYIETHPAPSANRLREPGSDRDRGRGRADKPGATSGSRAPARPQHG
jgi:hypothetical protein